MKNLEHYHGKDIAKELLKERIEALEAKDRNFVENARLNALVELQMEIEAVESAIMNLF